MMRMEKKLEIQGVFWAFLLFFFVLGNPVLAKPEVERLETSSKKGWDLFDIFSGDSSSEADKKEVKENEKKEATQTKLIIKPPVTPAETAPPAPYLVYPSPYVPQINDPVFRSPTPKSKALVEPPTLSLNDKNNDKISDKDIPIPSLETPSAHAQASEPPAQQPDTIKVPAAVLATGFSPLLPLNAPDGTDPLWLPYASNRELTADHSAITRAIIFIHDLARNPSEGVAILTTLAGNDYGTTLILAPQFPLQIDITRFADHLPDEGKAIARWPIGGVSSGEGSGWHIGGDSIVQGRQRGVSSFTAIDLMLLFLADQQTFPQLQQIVIAGHGMGGDFIQRYAAAGQAPDLLAAQGLPVRFLVANPSAYLYLTRLRPVAVGSNFAIPDANQCPDINDYPYGLNNLVPYARRSGPNAMRLRYPERRVMYLLSEKIRTDMYIERGCAASIQGKDRLTRGRNYERYLRMSFGETAERSHTFALIPNADYDPVALFGSYCGQAMLFGDGTCSSTLMPR